MTSFKAFCTGAASLLYDRWNLACSAGLLGVLTLLLLFGQYRAYAVYDLCVADGFILLHISGLYRLMIVPLFAVFAALTLRFYRAQNLILQFGRRRIWWLHIMGRLGTMAAFGTLVTTAVVAAVSAAFSQDGLTNFESRYSLFYAQTQMSGGVSFAAVVVKSMVAVFCLLLFTVLLIGGLYFFTERIYIGLLIAVAFCYWNLPVVGIVAEIRCSYLSFLEPDLTLPATAALLLLLFVAGTAVAKYKEVAR